MIKHHATSRFFFLCVFAGHAEDIHAVVGQDVTIHCRQPLPDGTRVRWIDWVYNERRDPIEIYNSDTGLVNTDHPNVDIFEVDPVTFALTISSFKFEDHGEYVCLMTSPDGQQADAEHNINVVGK